MPLSISQVSFEHHRTALGIGESSPRISWRFDGGVSDWWQSAYDIEINRADHVRRYHVNSSDSVLVPWPGEPLQSGEEATVRVRSTGRSHHHGNTAWSDPVNVEAGLLTPDDWQGAEAIVSDRATEVNGTHRPIHFRKDFVVDETILAARLYITALGVYKAHLNGQPVGDLVLAPGWQSYTHRHEYNTYDVTDLLQPGTNTIGVTVGEGWWAGALSWTDTYNVYGDTLGMLGLLSITTANGTKVFVPSDGTWQSSTGPIVASEIYNGEIYDSTKEINGWDSPGYDTSSWLGTHSIDFDKSVLAAPDSPPVRPVEARQLQSVFRSASGKTVIDFGQNLVGWLRVRVKGPRGTKVSFLHTEVMENGEVATRPLRTAKATDNLTLSGEYQEWEPSFTYHGFRYVQVDGWPEETKLDADAISAVVIHTDMERTGYFQSSNPLINKLHENILWSLRGNFFSLPTDCPQRDERLGWTGDINAFSRTANFLYNTAGFLRGWLKDARSEQLENNYAPPLVVPNVLGPGSAMALWGDVIIGVPWALYQTYGDVDMLSEQYAGAKDWIDKGIIRNEVGLWNRSADQLGDWLDPVAPPDNPGAGTTSSGLVADAYLVHSTELLANMSAYLSLSQSAAKYNRDRTALARQFQKTWIKNGIVANESQTGLVLPLYFNLFAQPDHYTSAVVKLTELITNNDYKIGTGFAGTHLVGHALSKYDAADTFYDMLLNEQNPGWLYQVLMNATTTWERWDSMLPNGTLNPGSMTSFNHYAVGSVGSWMYENIAGLSAAEPGWRRFNVDVRPGGDLTFADVTFLSPYGEIRVEWSIKPNAQCRVFSLSVQVPANSEAYVQLPGRAARRTNGGRDDVAVVGSGIHRFRRCLD
ncbi:bacterial alpha-L-rhamnosidase-domain-containing protein [Aspergillus heterothallicus]